LASTSGAVIEGTVSSAGGSAPASTSSLRTPAATPASRGLAGIGVQVVGTDLATTVGDDGRFRLVGAPGVTVRLRFQGAAINATAELRNVSDDQIIQLQVQLSATSAVIVDDVREGKVELCHAEGNGSYHPVTVSDSAEPAHRAHGDGRVNDPVPGRPTMTFDETCRLAGPEVAIEKSTNGDDADSAPGPELIVGAQIVWAYDVFNSGTVTLTDIIVTDSRGVAVECPAASLAAGSTLTCTGSGTAVLGQYENLGVVTARGASAVDGSLVAVTDSDASHYLGVTGTEEEEGPKVTLCHKTGSGRYVKITVSVNAEPAHRAHGDGEVGEAVPDLPGRTFSASCSTE
jgi:hypothetical protein